MKIREQMAALKAAMQSIVDTAKAEARDLTEDEAAAIEAKAAEHETLAGQLAKADRAASVVEQLANAKADEHGPSDAGGTSDPAGVGEAFVKSDAYQAFRKAHPTGVGSGTPIRIEAKGLGRLATVNGKATITTETGQIETVREPGYRNLLPVDEPLTFLDLITTGTTNVPFSEYAQVVAETNAAGIVLEGDLKPLSDIETALAESKAYTYADGFDVTNQTLADDGALVAFLEARIRRHVMGVVEAKVFNGSGTNEPTGIMQMSGTLASGFDTDLMTSIAAALATFEANNDTAPQAIVLRPEDIWKLRLARENGDTGAYLLGNPLQQGLNPSPFGVPIVRSNKLPVGTALVGRFDSVNFLTLEPLSVLAFNQHKDYAQRNMTYVRAEMRGRQLCYMPREIVVAEVAEPTP